MEISRLRVHNYRSIKDIDLECRSVMVLLGENNAGKSNILSSIEFLLTGSAKPAPEDLFAFREDDDETLWVEITFTQLTSQEKNTFQRYLLRGDKVRIRKTASWDQNGNVSIQYNGYTEEPKEEWLQLERAGEYASRAKVDNTPLAGYVPPNGRTTKSDIEAAQKKYIEDHADSLEFDVHLENNPLFGRTSVAAGILPDFYLIPAVRDLDDEAKSKGSTLFGKLLSKALEDMTLNNQEYGQLQDDIHKLVTSLNKSDGNTNRPTQLSSLESNLEEELAHWGVRVSIQVKPPEMSRIFEMDTSLYIDDGLNTPAQKKGHGLQRAVIFGLIRAWTKTIKQENADGNLVARKASESTIFVVEEPELFLHPQAQRTLAQTLRIFGESDLSQVFLCSHSPHFVDLDHYRDIAIVSKPSTREGTIVKQCTKDLFDSDDLADRKKRFHMAYWVNPDRGEMFFARKVVFVEGETEKALLPYLSRKLDCYTPEVSVIECGSKHNLPLYVSIAQAFSLNYHVIHDEDCLPDPIPSDWDDQKRKQKGKTYALNDELATLIGEPTRISICCPDFEEMCGISKTQSGKKGKALAALEHFENFGSENIPVGLAQIVQRVYCLGT